MTDMSQSPIGKSLVRREDERFLTGRGQYTDDVVLPGQTWGSFVRSPHAHARILSVNTEAALAMPGVVAIFTGKDIAASGIGGLPCGWLIHSRDGSPMKEPPHPIIAADKVLHVGDQVALVVAESAIQAKDAAEAVEVEYEVLSAVVDPARASSAPAALHEAIAPDNVCYTWGHGDEAAVEAAFAGAGFSAKQDAATHAALAIALAETSMFLLVGPTTAAAECPEAVAAAASDYFLRVMQVFHELP